MGPSVVLGPISKGLEAQPEVWTRTEKHLRPWDHHPSTPLLGLLHSLISPGRAAQRGWGRTGVPQDSWLTGPLWDSAPDPGVLEAVIPEL